MTEPEPEHCPYDDRECLSRCTDGCAKRDLSLIGGVMALGFLALVAMGGMLLYLYSPG